MRSRVSGYLKWFAAAMAVLMMVTSSLSVSFATEDDRTPEERWKGEPAASSLNYQLTAEQEEQILNTCKGMTPEDIRNFIMDHQDDYSQAQLQAFVALLLKNDFPVPGDVALVVLLSNKPEDQKISAEVVLSMNAEETAYYLDWLSGLSQTNYNLAMDLTLEGQTKEDQDAMINWFSENDSSANFNTWDSMSTVPAAIDPANNPVLSTGNISDNDEGNSEYESVSELGDAETQAYIQRLNEMSKEEIVQFFEKLDQELSQEQMIEFGSWLAKNGFSNPNVSDEVFEETAEVQSEYASVSELGDAETQAYIQRLNEMSKEEIVQFFEKLDQELSQEQMMEFGSWLAKNGFSNPNVSDEVFEETAEVQSEYEAVSKMSDEEKQAYIQRLNEMSKDEITEYMQNLNCDLLPDQMVEFNGWFEKYGFNNPNLTEESFAAGNENEEDGAIYLSDFAKMNYEEQLAFLEKLKNMSPEDLNAVMCQSAEGLTEEMQEMLIGWIVENNDLSKLDMDNWFSGSTDAAPDETTEASENEVDGGVPNLSDFAKMNYEEQLAFLEKLKNMSPEDLNAVMCQSAEGLTEEMQEMLIGWIVENNDLSTLDMDNWFSGNTAAVSEEATEASGNEAESKPFSQMTEEERAAYLDELNAMSGEDLYDLICYISETVSDEELQEYWSWFAVNGIFDKACPSSESSSEQSSSSGFSVPRSCEWPANVPTPDNGKLRMASVGGDTFQAQLAGVTQDDYQAWKTKFEDDGTWKDDNETGKTKIDKAIQKDFGPTGQTADEFFAEQGGSGTDDTYYVRTDGDGSALLALCGEAALVVVSQEKPKDSSGVVYSMEMSDDEKKALLDKLADMSGEEFQKALDVNRNSLSINEYSELVNALVDDGRFSDVI